MGGDRIWIALNFPFFTKSREHFKESYTVQPGIDPADYHISSEAPGLIELSSLLQADLYESSWKHSAFISAARSVRSQILFRHPAFFPIWSQRFPIVVF